MFTGKRISADEAVALVLINYAGPDDELMDRSFALAESIANKSPLTLKLLKRALIEGIDMPIAPALRHEQAMISLSLDSADAHEGCTAFLEKRPAEFRGS